MKLLLGILGGDAALHGVAVEPRRPAGGTPIPASISDLPSAIRICALHDVDAGHLLGHGVLDLHARVDLDEVEGAGVHIHQELDRAGAFVVHIGDLEPNRQSSGALGLVR
jgi:hypothetical protein